jgi:hypothetical protein
MCDSSGTSDPTTYDRPTCGRLIWRSGQDRPCGQSVGIKTWTDHTGAVHHGCTAHIDGMLRRYPASIVERLPDEGDAERAAEMWHRMGSL